MPNWCDNSIAFYQEDGGNAVLEAFYTDMERCLNYKDPETGECSGWVGNWLKVNGIDAKNLSARGFITNCELNGDHVCVNMESAWAPISEVWDLIAERYGLVYVYKAEEPGCEVFVNTDAVGRFFSDRYILNYFDVDDLDLDDGIMAEYGERLREFGEETLYFESWDDVMEAFEPFGFDTSDIDALNERLEMFNIQVYEYADE
jgi:hypothetical protein